MGFAINSHLCRKKKKKIFLKKKKKKKKKKGIQGISSYSNINVFAPNDAGCCRSKIRSNNCVFASAAVSSVVERKRSS